MPNPASQTLLKAFLQALYSDDFIPVCEEEFGFNRITGDLRDKALSAIDEMIVTEGAPEWTFENDTFPRTGQEDFVISVKRDTYSGLAQKSASDSIASLTAQLQELQASYSALKVEFDEMAGTDSSVSASAAEVDNEDVDENQVKLALGLAAVSFSLWMLAIIGLLLKFVLKM
jgi:hypothetical protein